MKKKDLRSNSSLDSLKEMLKKGIFDLMWNLVALANNFRDEGKQLNGRY